MKASINIPLVFALGALLVACGGGGSTTTSSGDNDSGTTGTANTTTTTTTTAGGSIAPAITAPDGSRLLASQCFQCHGMNGVSASGIDSIAGESAASLVEEMLEMKYSTEIDIMHYQAKGYSEDEIRSMAVYIAALPRSANGDND
ncbi:c-type cytochrome [Thiothrix subterranea]|uniref:Cytochrome c class I n=1 Tax=Thiothrix subterranea TaxID=2735563 RepID=A0AA51MRW4_9GAMM|nr:cytochrome c class I [Thiothrix subterranea]MDQ5769793.1 cytochrome c class I [Thiothrix subterranea]WML87181.1 cytochrome c class I [Thiothrix subterranea]